MTDPQPQFDDELEPFDLLMYRCESNPHTRSSMMALILLDKTPDFAELTYNYERASRVFIRLRQRVVLPSIPLVKARWVVDPDFDLRFHLRRVAVPGPGTMNEVLEFANQFLSDPIDSTRPLWETILLEDIQEPGCQAALLLKIHHAVTDGIGGMLLFRELFDLEPIAPRRPMPLQPIPEEISGKEIVRKALLQKAGNWLPNLRKKIGKGISNGGEWLAEPKQSLEKLRLQVESASRVLGELPAPPSPLLRERSLARRLATMEIPLQALRTKARAQAASVNDAYLAGVAGGLRLYHQQMAVHIDELAVTIPVNMRRADEVSGGNNFAAARLALPISEADANKRLAIIHQRVRVAIAEPGLNILKLAAPVIAVLPDAAVEGLACSILAPDVQVSNVPGSPVPLYLNGCKLIKIFPFGPVPGVAAMITLFTLTDTCYLGLHMDTAAITDTGLFMRCMEDGFTEVTGVSTRKPKRTRAARKKAPAKPRKPRSAAKEVKP